MYKMKSALALFAIILGAQYAHAATFDLGPRPNSTQSSCMSIVTPMSVKTDPSNGLNMTLSNVDFAIHYTNEQLVLGTLLNIANQGNQHPQVKDMKSLISDLSPDLTKAAAVLCLIDDSDGRHSWHVSRDNVMKSYEPSVSSAREILTKIKAGEIEPYQFIDEVKNLTIDLCDNTDILDRGKACDYFSDMAALKDISESELVIYKREILSDVFVGQYSTEGLIVFNRARELLRGFQVQVLAPNNGTGIGNFIAQSKDLLGYQSYTATVNKRPRGSSASIIYLVPWEDFKDSLGNTMPHPKDLPRLIIKANKTKYMQ
jgi:hypothetical protein